MRLKLLFRNHRIVVLLPGGSNQTPQEGDSGLKEALHSSTREVSTVDRSMK